MVFLVFFFQKSKERKIRAGKQIGPEIGFSRDFLFCGLFSLTSYFGTYLFSDCHSGTHFGTYLVSYFGPKARNLLSTRPSGSQDFHRVTEDGSRFLLAVSLCHVHDYPIQFNARGPASPVSPPKSVDPPASDVNVNVTISAEYLPGISTFMWPYYSAMTGQPRKERPEQRTPFKCWPDFRHFLVYHRATSALPNNLVGLVAPSG